jgi:hypothetical protein
MNIQLFTFIFMWIASLMIMLSPVLVDKVNDEAKPWVVSALILVLIPFTLNLIARGGYKFIKLGNFGVDHKFIFLACGIAYAIASIFISSWGKVKQDLRAFGKDIKSTGMSLALLVPAFVGGLVFANVFNDGSRYIFRVSY